MADGSVVIEILADAAKFNAALAKVERSASKSLSSLGGAAYGIGTALTAGVTAPLGAAAAAAGKWALDTASAAEQADIALSTMIGPERAKALLADLAEFARTTPFEMAGLTDATQKLLAYGFAAEDVVPMLTAVGDAAAGLGAGQAGVDSITRALGQMQAKGKASAEEMLQLTEVGVPAWQYLADAVSDGDIPAAMQMVTDGAVDANTAISALQDGMSRDFGGLMEKQSTTLSGSLSNLTDAAANAIRQIKDTDAWKQATEAVSRLAESIGPLVEKMLPVAERGLSAVAGVLTDVASAIDGLDAGDIEGIVDGAVKLAATGPGLMALGKAMDFASKGLDKASGLSGALSRGLGKITEAFRLASGGAGTLAESISAAGAAGPIAAAGVAALTAVVGVAAAAYADWRKRQEDLSEATSGLNDVVSDTAALEGYAGTVESVGEASEASAMSVDQLAESTARRVETMRQNTDAAEQEIALLNTAQGIINQYAGQTDLTADAQGRLQWALQLVNDEFGTSITQSDVAADSYTNQEGEVVDLTDSINGLIDAKKEEARVSAVSANLTEAYQAQTDAAATLAQAQADYADKVDSYMSGMAKNGKEVTRAQAEAWAATTKEGQALASAEAQYGSASAAVSSYEEQLGDAAAASSEAADEYDRLSSTMGSGKFDLFSAQLDTAGTSFSQLSDDLRSLGADTEAFAALSEDELAAIAGSYDGTAASIAGMLRELGVTSGEFTGVLAQAGADVQSTSAIIADAMGLSLGQLEQQLADAGISTQQLNEIGSANLAAMAANCNGSMTQLIWMIQNYNAQPIVDKNGRVTVDQTQLMDAEGKVYEWNGNELLDQDGQVVVDDVQLTDAQGNVVEWNGSELKLLQGAAEVDDGDLEDALDLVRRWNSSSLKTLTGSATVTTTNRTVNVVEEQTVQRSAARPSPAAMAPQGAGAGGSALQLAAARLAAAPAPSGRASSAAALFSGAAALASRLAGERPGRSSGGGGSPEIEAGIRELGRKVDAAASRIERAVGEPSELRVNRREFGRLVKEVS